MKKPNASPKYPSRLGLSPVLAPTLAVTSSYGPFGATIEKYIDLVKEHQEAGDFLTAVIEQGKALRQLEAL